MGLWFKRRCLVLQDISIISKLMGPMTEKKSFADFLAVSKSQIHQKLGFAYFQSSQNYILQSLEQETEFKV